MYIRQEGFLNIQQNKNTQILTAQRKLGQVRAVQLIQLLMLLLREETGKF